MNYKNEFLNQYGIEDVCESNLAEFVNDNWGGITGLDDREKDNEQDFPIEVVELIEALDLDYDEFSYAWGDVREGCDEDCDWNYDED